MNNTFEEHISAATVMVENQQFEEAIKQYQALIARNPEKLPILMDLAAVYIVQKQEENAMELYQQVLLQNPYHYEAANNLAWFISHQEDGDLTKATTLALLARKGITNKYLSWDTLGWIYFRRGQYDEAIDQFNQVLAEQPDEPQTLYQMAEAYHAKGEFFKAVEALRLALASTREFQGRTKAEALLKKLE